LPALRNVASRRDRDRVDAPGAAGAAVSKRKERPALGTPVTPDMSLRDIGAALGLSPRLLWQCKQIASIPQDEFEAALAAPLKPTTESLVNLARRRNGSEPRRTERCAHCGQVIRKTTR